MLKTYRIIPLVFILFLFGFTLISVAPVFAQPECTPDPNYDGGKMCRQNPNARSYQECMGRCNPSSQPPFVAPTPSPSGGEVAELNAKISGLEARLGEVAKLNAKISELEARSGEVAELNARIAELEGKLAHTADAPAQKPRQACANYMRPWSKLSNHHRAIFDDYPTSKKYNIIVTTCRE